MGTSAEAKAAARDIPIKVRGGVTVFPVSRAFTQSFTIKRLTSFPQGDIIFCDPFEGVVVIPRDLLDPVLDLMPKLISMDEKAIEAVAQGMSVTQAFKEFRA